MQQEHRRLGQLELQDDRSIGRIEYQIDTRIQQRTPWDRAHRLLPDRQFRRCRVRAVMVSAANS